MNKRFVLVAWILTVDGNTEFRSFVFRRRYVAEQNAEALRDTLGKCTFYVNHYDVEIVEVEA